MSRDILDEARSQVLHEGSGLDEGQIARCLSLPSDRLGEALALAHEVRMRWCGPEVEVEGIVSVKTGGCPEDCHFCSQSGQFSSPVRAVWLDIAELVDAARATAATGATEFCIVAAVRGPDQRLMSQVGTAVRAITAEVGIHVACSLGDPHPGPGGRAGRFRGAPLQPQPGGREVLLRPGGDHPYLGGARPPPVSWSRRPAWNCAAAASSAWARRRRSAPNSPPSSPPSARTRCR